MTKQKPLTVDDGPFSGSKFYDPDLVSEEFKQESLAKAKENIRTALERPDVRGVMSIVLVDDPSYKIGAVSNIVGFTNEDVEIAIQYLQHTLARGEKFFENKQ